MRVTAACWMPPRRWKPPMPQAMPQAIRAAMAALDAALRGQALAQAEVKDAGAREDAAQSAVATDPAETPAQAVAQGSPAANGKRRHSKRSRGTSRARTDQAPDTEGAWTSAPASEPAPVAPAPKPRPVVAVRGDDRPGMKKDAPAAAGRTGKWNDRKDGARAGRDARPDEVADVDAVKTAPVVTMPGRKPHAWVMPPSAPSVRAWRMHSRP